MYNIPLHFKAKIRKKVSGKLFALNSLHNVMKMKGKPFRNFKKWNQCFRLNFLPFLSVGIEISNMKKYLFVVEYFMNILFICHNRYFELSELWFQICLRYLWVQFQTVCLFCVKRLDKQCSTETWQFLFSYKLVYTGYRLCFYVKLCTYLSTARYSKKC